MLQNNCVICNEKYVFDRPHYCTRNDSRRKVGEKMLQGVERRKEHILHSSRQALGKTMRQVSEATGLSPQLINRAESSPEPISFDTLDILCEYYSLDKLSVAMLNLECSVAYKKYDAYIKGLEKKV